jgi:tetratricopeptide (TPR) repeat protein
MLAVASPTLAAQWAPADPIEAKRLIDTRQLDSAETMIVAELMRAPRDAQWITLLAEVRLGQNRTLEAWKLINDANELAGLTATRAMLTSLAYSQAGFMDRAEEPIRVAVQLEPNNPTAHYFLARLLYTDNRFDESITESKRVIELAPDFVRAYENLGLSYEGRYQRDEAEHWYREAIKRQAASAQKTEWPMVDLAVLLIHENRYDEARPYLVEALAINPNNTQSLVQMGTLLENDGDLKGALDRYRAAIRSDESDLQPGRASAYYKAARLCKKLGYTEEAVQYFKMFNEVHDNRNLVMR